MRIPGCIRLRWESTRAPLETTSELFKSLNTFDDNIGACSYSEYGSVVVL
jgi:hypothetical protein